MTAIFKFITCIKISALKRSFLILVCFLAMISKLNGQTVYYYGVNSRPVEFAEDARMKKELRQKSEIRYFLKTSVVSNSDKKNDGWLITEKEKIRIGKDGILYIRKNAENYFSKKIHREMIKREDGIYEFSESDEGKVLRTGFSSRYLPLHLEGRVTEYHSNGKVKSISQYSNNQLISNQNWLKNGDKYIDSIFFSADREPEYKMGPDFFHKYILQNLYNSDIDLTQIQDMVEVAWVIMENGEMDGVFILSGSYQELNQILVKTIAEMPGEWQPAILDGKAVRYFITVPLNFSHLASRFQDLELSGGVMHYNRY